MDGLKVTMQEIIRSLFAVDSIWSVILRGAIWFGISIVIIISVDTVNKSGDSTKNVRANLGFFLLFLILLGVLLYLLFGFAPKPA
jgi:hypothetical protein